MLISNEMLSIVKTGMLERGLDRELQKIRAASCLCRSGQGHLVRAPDAPSVLLHELSSSSVLVPLRDVPSLVNYEIFCSTLSHLFKGSLNINWAKKRMITELLRLEGTSGCHLALPLGRLPRTTWDANCRTLQTD